MKRRACQNAFIIGFLSLVFIEAVPVNFSPLNRLRNWIDPVMDISGLWQGTWDLFAPNVDKQNNWIEANIYFIDHNGAAPLLWRSPGWAQKNCLQKFALSRDVEFYDRLPLDRSSNAWEPTATHLANRMRKAYPERRIEKIELISVTVQIFPPVNNSAIPEVERRVFYSKEFNHD